MKHPDMAHLLAALDFARQDAANLRYAAQPFLRIGRAGVNHPGDAPLTLTVTADDMRRLNRAAAGGDTALALQARLGRLVFALPMDMALWNGDPHWRVGRYAGRRWAWGPGEDSPIEALEGHDETPS